MLDPLHGYLLLAERLLEAPPGDVPGALNFGPPPDESCTVGELVDRLSAGFGGSPGWRQDGDPALVPETAALRLDASLAKRAIGWSPVLDLDGALGWTVDWYRAWRDGEDMRRVTLAQIDAYTERL